MSQPAIFNLNPIYKNCNWAVVLTFPYTITNIDFAATLVVPGGTNINISTSRLDSTRLKLSLTAEQIKDLEITNYEVNIQQTTDLKAVAKCQVPVAEFEV